MNRLAKQITYINQQESCEKGEVDMDFEKNCCFCGREVLGIGHNPKPVIMREGAVCCDFCDCNIVLRERLRMFWEEEEVDA